MFKVTTIKTEDSKQNGADRVTGNPPAIRTRWVPPTLRQHNVQSEEARRDEIFRKVRGNCFNQDLLISFFRKSLKFLLTLFHLIFI